MQIDQPYLFVEINDKNFIFLVVQYNQDLEFKILHSTITPSQGVINGKITDVLLSNKIIKETVEKIEKKINYIFKNVTVICDQQDFSCVNISGFKKLNGSQISNEDISYILNNIKKTIIENQPENSLVHLFNSNFVLDKTSLDKLPTGLYGEFYNQHMTFFLLSKINLKNLKLVFNNCSLNIERIIFKSFAEGIYFINKRSLNNSFALINIEKNKSNISFFKNFSLIYYETFPFGTDIILKDVSKLCTLNFFEVENIFEEICFDKIQLENKDNYLDKNFFKESSFRKISLGHLKDIIKARTEEIANLIYKKNINLKHLLDGNKHIHLKLEDLKIFKNLNKSFEKLFSEEIQTIVEEVEQNEKMNACYGSAELIGRGWEREAIPIIQTKKSIISRLFSTFFK
tara:strand:+ start:3767 stop:4969 length:1203 start_codon:yes stop_codon:yes gene_type:complete